ncbi:hypothetical protein Hamer_G019381 [Homarus americanus]|uniref:Uncharacterized protein n=1 Tax=Homarus americanus TaxID=6706 RepID=A0A8J5JV30_HOMAM|nr:hypothetical protein Hamer_G019381 [Homarus americanus]
MQNIKVNDASTSPSLNDAEKKAKGPTVTPQLARMRASGCRRQRRSPSKLLTPCWGLCEPRWLYHKRDSGRVRFASLSLRVVKDQPYGL